MTVETSRSPAPEAEASATPETQGGFDISKLTPEQQDAVRLAIIKLSQNPIGNITVLESQNNFNYGIGPYTRYGYNMNVEPVVPIELSPTWNLVARTILPIVVLPSFAPPTVLRYSRCLRIDVRHRGHARGTLLWPQDQTGSSRLGGRSDPFISYRFAAERPRNRKVGRRIGRCCADYAGQVGYGYPRYADVVVRRTSKLSELFKFSCRTVLQLQPQERLVPQNIAHFHRELGRARECLGSSGRRRHRQSL